MCIVKRTVNLMINRFVKVSDNCSRIRSTWRAYYAPDLYYRHCWDILMIFVITSLLMLVPYQATFELGKMSKIWNISKNFLLLVCCGDIMVNLMTGQVSRVCPFRILIHDVMARLYTFSWDRPNGD